MASGCAFTNTLVHCLNIDVHLILVSVSHLASVRQVKICFFAWIFSKQARKYGWGGEKGRRWQFCCLSPVIKSKVAVTIFHGSRLVFYFWSYRFSILMFKLKPFILAGAIRRELRRFCHSLGETEGHQKALVGVDSSVSTKLPGEVNC